ncbi:hypothetical protein QUF58_04560 [Anaerolineales bacterium HSG24]|nr:hypothetical protein [Anaerolineales bacterium HSG24]
MQLSSDDAKLFYKILWPLYFYTNQQLNVVENVSAPEDFEQPPQEKSFKVRDALFKNLQLIDQFVAANPNKLSESELKIAHSWKKIVVGRFYIFRFLKRHAIFVSAEGTDQIYGVLGITNSIQEMFYGAKLPLLVHTALLPFKGKIIYDGVISPYSISFGSGIRGNINEAYQRAKQNKRLIVTFEPELQTSTPKKELPDWRPTLRELVATTKRLKGADNILQTKSYTVLKASAELAHAATYAPDDLGYLDKLTRKVERAIKQMNTVIKRAEWE